MQVAQALHKRLQGEGVQALVKTSGKTGLHLLTPWASAGRREGYDKARDWALGHAQAVCDALPDLATTHRLKASRGQRVYIDTVQNALGHHVVPPYVLRAVPQATISTPLKWSEVTARLNPRKFTPKTIFGRLERAGDIMSSLL